jgi:ubiquinone/menaquinone biosynthesis C-methylase UbiE
MSRTKASTAKAATAGAPKNWWRSFFSPLAGKVMFEPRMDRSGAEVDAVLRRTRTRPGASILDLACGTGRHTLIFAQKGYDVVGLDYSQPYLREAREKLRNSKRGIRCRFVRGDMRYASRYVGRDAFDLAVSLYNSFGYFDRRSDDRRMLREVFRVLRPGGAFVINTLRESGVRRRFKTPLNVGHEPVKNVFALDDARYDAAHRRTISNWVIVDARKRRARIERLRFGQNVYSHAALKALLRAAGFRIERAWGALDGARLRRTSWHQTIVARKPLSRRRRAPGS